MTKRFEMRRSAGVTIEVMSPKSELPYQFLSWDLSPRGAFLMTDATPSIGDRLLFSFKLGDCDKEFSFFGEVTRVDRGRRAADRGPRGFGVSFLDCTPWERLKIRHALRGLPPPPPKPKRQNALTEAMGWA